MPEILQWTDPVTEGNCYICAEGGGAIVIDPARADGPMALLEARGLTPEWILLTHEHCDHMAGLEALRRRYPSARVLTSAACSRGLQDRRVNMSLMMEVYLTFKGKPGIQYPPFVCQSADETFVDARTLSWRDHLLHLTALPGHTPGSTCIRMDETILFSGDYLIPGEPVITRLPGGEPEVYEAVARPWLAALEPGLSIYPGHGAPYTLTEEMKQGYGLYGTAEPGAL